MLLLGSLRRGVWCLYWICILFWFIVLVGCTRLFLSGYRNIFNLRLVQRNVHNSVIKLIRIDMIHFDMKYDLYCCSVFICYVIIQILWISNINRWRVVVMTRMRITWGGLLKWRIGILRSCWLSWGKRSNSIRDIKISIWGRKRRWRIKLLSLGCRIRLGVMSWRRKDS